MTPGRMGQPGKPLPYTYSCARCHGAKTVQAGRKKVIGGWLCPACAEKRNDAARKAVDHIKEAA